MSSSDKISGIYFIRCTETNKGYVGSSIDAHYRIKRHLTALRRGTHGSPLLQRSWNKYGESGFQTGILEQCSREVLIEREQWWIDNHASEFNIAREASRVTGWRATPEQKAAQSIMTKSLWEREGYKERVSKKISDAWTPKLRAEAKARGIESWASQDKRKELGTKIRASLSTEEARAARSAQRRADWADPDKRARILAGRAEARHKRTTQT